MSLRARFPTVRDLDHAGESRRAFRARYLGAPAARRHLEEASVRSLRVAERLAVFLQALLKRVLVHHESRAVGEGHEPLRLVARLLSKNSIDSPLATLESPGDGFVATALRGECHPSVNAGHRGFRSTGTHKVLGWKVVGEGVQEC